MSLLDFLISPAAAQAGGAPAASNPIYTVVWMVALCGIMYFLMIRPQTKRAKEHRDLVSKLAKGDEIITNGGLAGRIDELGENFITVEIADGVRVKLQRAAIAAVLPKGTLKSA
jgi:preprotein translocase subunit YajC